MPVPLLLPPHPPICVGDRKVLEQKQKAEEEEKRWQERQRERERRLQKVISLRAEANDPHQTLAKTCQTKLKEFRY